MSLSRQQVLHFVQTYHIDDMKTKDVSEVWKFARNLIEHYELPCDHDYVYQSSDPHGDCTECGRRLFVSY